MLLTTDSRLLATSIRVMSDLTLKIIVLGAANVGKTSIMRRYATGKFSPERRATIGSDFMNKSITLYGVEIMLQIWDTAGQERFHQNSVGASFYRGAHGALLVYDVTNPLSMLQLMKWRDEITEKLGEANTLPIVVIANKIDLRNDSSPDCTDVLNWCQQNYYGHIETSAKDDLGVSGAMNAIAALAIDRTKDDEVADRSNANQRHSIVLESKFEKPKSKSCC